MQVTCRQTGMQFNITDNVQASSTPVPIRSSTPTPFISSSPAFVRDLISEGVDGTTPTAANESVVLDNDAATILTPPGLPVDSSRLASPPPAPLITSPFPGTLFPPPLLGTPLQDHPRLISNNGPSAMALHAAVSFLEKNGYTCLKETLSSTVLPSDMSGAVVQSSSQLSEFTVQSESSNYPQTSSPGRISTASSNPKSSLESRKRKRTEKKLKSRAARCRGVHAHASRIDRVDTLISCSNVTQFDIKIGNV